MYSNLRPLNAEPVTVPANFVGMTSLVDTHIAAGTNVIYRHARSWGYYRYAEGLNYPSGGKYLAMNTLNPSSGVFNWTQFDLFFSRNKTTCPEFIFCLGFPADYLVATAASGSPELGGKSNKCPTDLVTWASVVTAMVNRAKNTHGVTGITWELWNEFDVTTGQFWLDSFTNMAAYARATYIAAKAADPTCKIAGPSISGTGNGPGYISSFMTASDGSGGLGRDWIDCIGFHPYQPFAPDTVVQYTSRYNAIKAAVKSGGNANLPLWITETGIPSSNIGGLPVDPNGSKSWARRMICFAALGVERFTGFGIDENKEGYSILPFLDGWNKAASLLVNSPKIQAFYDPSSTNVLAVINGATYVFD